MVADVLTKALPKSKHIYCVKRMGVMMKSNLGGVLEQGIDFLLSDFISIIL